MCSVTSISISYSNCINCIFHVTHLNDKSKRNVLLKKHLRIYLCQIPGGEFGKLETETPDEEEAEPEITT